MTKCYIHNASSITARGLESGFDLDTGLDALAQFDAIEPDYSELIPPALRRRMSKITRIGMANANILSNAVHWDAIIVGTAIGNISDTLDHLKKIRENDGGLIAPTSFIQSGHNTLAGQIALSQKNHGYNTTYVQGGQSFYNALIDAQLQILEGKNHVLVGAMDEMVTELKALIVRAEFDSIVLQEASEGASFFHLSSIPSSLFIRALHFIADGSQSEKARAKFLKDQGLRVDEVLYFETRTYSTSNSRHDITSSIGRYLTNDAYAMHRACSALHRNKEKFALVSHEVEDGHQTLILIENDSL